MKKKERKRSTHLELLGGVPSDALRRIREVAVKADLPLERVFRDVIAIGVSVVTDPGESPYQSLIAFRGGLASKQAELEHEEHPREDREFPESGEPGIPDGPLPAIDSGDIAESFAEEAIEERFDDALERPGLEAPDEEITGLSSAE